MHTNAHPKAQALNQLGDKARTGTASYGEARGKHKGPAAKSKNSEARRWRASARKLRKKMRWRTLPILERISSNARVRNPNPAHASGVELVPPWTPSTPTWRRTRVFPPLVYTGGLPGVKLEGNLAPKRPKKKPWLVVLSLQWNLLSFVQKIT
jgi:hypothetical protein